MIKKIMACVLIAGMLTGCAGADYGDYSQSVDTTNNKSAQMITSYLDKRAVADSAIMQSMMQGGTPETRAANQMAMMMYGMLQQQNDRQLLTTYAPKYLDKPVTNGDIGMAVTTSLLPTLIKAGVGVYLGGKIIDGLQTTSTTLGAGASMNNGTGSSTINNDSVSGGGDYNPPVETGYTTIESNSSTGSLLEGTTSVTTVDKTVTP